MDRLHILKQKLDACEKVFGFTANIRDEATFPQYAPQGADFVLFDLEHGPYNGEQVEPFYHIARANDIPTIVRIPDSYYDMAARQIDMGADGVLVPRVETAGQLKQVIDGVRFSPIGRKGVGGKFQFRRGETFEEFQKNRIILIQMESPSGIAQLPHILDVWGSEISGVIVGPYDLSVLSGTPLDLYSEPVLDNMRKVISVCNAYHKAVGCYVDTPEDAKKRWDLGFRILWMSQDTEYMLKGIRDAAAFAADL